MNKQTLEITSLIDEIMQNRLKNELNANDEELKTLENLLKIKKNSLKNNNNKMNSFEPSVIIKDFLYHGDLAHAIDINLLINLNINNIINLCDCPLDKSINEIFNVLWINNLEDDLNGNLIDYIDKTNQFINESKLKNEKVLVHCQAGISRSSSIILAYLIRSFLIILIFYLKEKINNFILDIII